MSDGDSAGVLSGLLGFIVLAVAYLLPSMLAFFRSKKSKRAIVLVNVFLGWTAIGWVVAFVWAIFGKRELLEVAAEPQGPGLDLAEVVAIDVETTGLSAKTDRVVELALAGVSSEGEVIWTWHSLFDPGRPIPRDASAIHGISDDRVKGAPAFAEKAGEISAKIEQKILLAHNLKFDVGFLREELKRCGRSLPASQGIDTLKISRRVDRGKKSHRLGDACRRYGIKLKNAHRATDDTIAAAKLFVAMRSRHGGKPQLFAPEKLVK